MQIYTCTKFKGHWPVGVAAVVVAKTRTQACLLLEFELEKAGLPQTITWDDMQFLCTTEARAVILNDGEY